mmetsp:Transcript_24925/g.51029  ORF Transcript_24925/g.51029 Transcript_24925/m.51029 type:complete len:149 (+) Transcript_24925:78-524(+)
MPFKRTLAVLFVALLVASSSAFAPIRNNNKAPSAQQIPASQLRTANAYAISSGSSRLGATSLNERQWNFNRGRGPFGMKKNAEIWNGRMAQIGFTFVLIQELITGKGAVQGLQEGDPVAVACMGIAVASVVGVTVFLALKGKESDITY